MRLRALLYTLTILLVQPARADEPFVETAGPITALAVLPTGTHLAFASEGTMQVWQLAPRVHVSTFRASKEEIHALAFAGAGNLLISGGADKSLRWWDFTTGKETLKVELPQPVTSLACAPDGKRLAAGDAAGTIRIVDAAAGKILATLVNQRRNITDLAFAADSKTLAAGSTDRTIVVWDLDKEKSRHVLKEHRGWISGLAYTADSKCLVSTGRDQRIKLWDPPTGTCFETFEEWDGAVQALAVHGAVIASAGLGRGIHLRHAQLGREIAELDGHAEAVLFLAFAGGGKQLVSASKQRIHVRDVSRHVKDGPLRPEQISPKLLDEVWDDLASPDEAKAVRTLRSLAALPELAVPLLEKRLAPVSPATLRRITGLIADLDSEQFDVREQASSALPMLGYLAEQAMKEALAGNPPLETRRRIERILRDMPDGTLMLGREKRAVDILERIGTKPARQLLGKLADGDAKASLTTHARAALERLGQN